MPQPWDAFTSPAVTEESFDASARRMTGCIDAGDAGSTPASDAVCSLWAEVYRRCKGKLSGPGQGINDMWIAACALAQPEPIPLVTANVKDFSIIAAAFPLVLVFPD